MLLQYKICTFAFSEMHALVCPSGSPHGGERERKAEGRRQGGIWEQGGTVLCLLPSHTDAKLNSNKIRHRCALLAPTSIVRSLAGGLVTYGFKRWIV